jgi:hypothetical protein
MEDETPMRSFLAEQGLASDELEQAAALDWLSTEVARRMDL